MKTTIRSMHLTFAAIALFCFALAPGAQGAPPQPANVDKATRARVSESYGKLPLSFEANKGQHDGQVKFLSRGSGYNLFLTDREAVLVLTKPEEAAPPPARKAAHATPSQKPKRQSTVLRTQLVAANPTSRVTGEEELPGKVNYFIGHDREKWRTECGDLRQGALRRGVSGHRPGLLRQPGATGIRFCGAARGRSCSHPAEVSRRREDAVDEQGQLVVQTAGGDVRWNKPGVYQEADGGRREVKGKYVLRPGHELGFEVAAYDTAKPLVIDPILVYSTFLGGSSDDYGGGIAVDTSGNAYVMGDTNSTNFPTTPGAFRTTKGGSSDAFVTKLNLTGSALVYSTYLGGSSDDYGQAIAVDTSGNAYVMGNTISSDFPTTPGAFQTTYGGGSDAFVTELNPAGSALVFSTYLGGSNTEYGGGIALDTSGNAYVTGYTNSENFPTTPGAFQTTKNGTEFSGDAFVTKLNPAGSALVYSTYLGGSGSAELNARIAVDTSGSAYVTGQTDSIDFPITAAAFQTTIGGGLDSYVTKLNLTGSALVYSTYLGGSSIEYGAGIAVDTSGNAYVTGYTQFGRLSHYSLELSRRPSVVTLMPL